MKALLSQRHVFKLTSGRLKKSNWDLKLTLKDAKKNDELIGLASSPLIRFIDHINGNVSVEERIASLKEHIKQLSKQKSGAESKRELKKYRKELDELLFVEDYLCVIMESNKDYDRLNQGFTINGKRYRRLLGTSGGIKKSIIIFTTEDHHDRLWQFLNNDRDMSKKFIPAKLEAYISLACSASIPVSNPNGVLVVRDCETTFCEDVIELDDSCEGDPKMTYKKDYQMKLNISDGLGLIMPHVAERWNKELHEDYLPSGFCIRNAFCKGMLFSFDFVQFAEEVAGTYEVTDVWGNVHDVRNIEVILTESMLKLWDSYESIDHYLECCARNGHQFSVTKNIPKELDEMQTLNYQFIQPLIIDDEDIYELCRPTIEEIHDILHMDYKKALLYLKGAEVTEDKVDLGFHDYVTALSIEPHMMKDPHVLKLIHNSIKTKITEAKAGVLKVRGNFAIIGGDPYALCQNMFGLEVTGLLKAGEFYSKHWIDRGVDKVAGMRAPQTSLNNMRIFNIVNTEEMQKWYKYMPTVLIYNAWDSTCSALNGADFDGDTNMTTDNPIIIKGIQPTPTIVCVQKGAEKVIPTEADFIKSNKMSFGTEIGSITNYITSMFSLQAKFEEGTEEWNVLDYRIKCGQLLQQNSIDKAKGVVSKPMSKHWHSYKVNKILEEDSPEVKAQKEFNLRVMCDKKPYFFNYVYPQRMKEYTDFVKKANESCAIFHGMKVDDLRSKPEKTQEEIDFLKYYDLMNPCEMSACTMNKIAWIFENEFDGIIKKAKSKDFDYTVMKSGFKYSKARFNRVKEKLSEYARMQQNYVIKNGRRPLTPYDSRKRREMFKEYLISEVTEICPNMEELCDIMLDACYKKEGSKRLVWDICEKQIVQNLLKRNEGRINFMEADKDGDTEFNGYKFTMKQKVLGGYNNENDSE